jgi:signal transduction histidine kinase/predicted ATPase
MRQLEDDTQPPFPRILVSGYSGSGKTLLVENYLQRLVATNPVLIARHYQRHQNIPYFGFKYCISDYLNKIYNKSNKAELQNFADRLKQYLGESFPLLTDYVPELSLIFGMKGSFPARSSLTIQNQLYPLFLRLFEFLSDFYNRPVFLFTDDLQWIDASGINLLKYLLLNLPGKKLVWIGACRELQHKSNLLAQLLEELRIEKIDVENMVLKGLTRNEVCILIEATLGAPCHADLIDICHTLTDGSQSRLQALLDMLKGSDLIWHDALMLRCNPEAVSIQFQAMHVQHRILGQVQKLSGDAYNIVCIMSCMGRFDQRIICDWLSGDEARMKVLLDEATDAGILELYDQEVRFSKMDVGELIYNELSENTKLNLHYRIANLFYDRGLERLGSTDMILMVDSFNESIDRVRSDGRIELVADLNYQIGKILQSDKAFDRARFYLKMSAELLKECSWPGVEEQVRLVYMERAKIEYSLREYDLAEIHLDYLLARIADPLKRSKVFELKLTINNHLARYQKAVWILKESLGELGMVLPVEEQILHEEVKRLKAILSLEETPRPDDKSCHRNAEHSEAVLRLLYVGGMSLHHTSDVLMTWAALQIILSGNHDQPSAVKAIGYVSYGRMLIISGDIQKGYEFGSKGPALNKELDDITLRCRVFGVYAFYIQPWVKDFAESDALLLAATEAGQKSGDLIGLYILKTHRLNLHLISGLPLKGLTRWDFEESYPGMELTYYITHYQKSLIQYLTGETPVFSIPRQNPSSLAGRLTIQEEKFYRHYVWARYYFLFGYFDLAARASEEAHDNCKLQEGSPLLPANLMIWFLSIMQNWYRYTEPVRLQMQIRVTEVMNLFASWKSFAPSNYEPAWLLINAEWLRIQGRNDEALRLFSQSFHASRSNTYHRAISAELWAKCLLSRNGEDPRARNLLQTSIDSFNEWNGVAKSRQLMQQFEAILFQASQPPQVVDIETIQYELSGDMEVSSLVSKLMVLLLRTSGSTRVVVELVEETGERAYYDELSLLHRREQAPLVPASMILTVLKSQNAVVVNELRAEQALRNVDELRESGIQSFLILPVTISGELSMVIYLENAFSSNWYTSERVKSVKITANQGAVMIGNARIHQHAVKLNEDLRTEMAEKERLSGVIELQKAAHVNALMQAQYSERKRIASDLHDSLGSLLSSVRLRFNGLQYEYCQRVPERAQGFEDSLILLDEAIEELRRISHNMVPVSLNRFGLKSALETFVAPVVASGTLTVDLQILGLDVRLSEELEVRIYRICQELVHNVIKHSQATKMRIQVILHRDSLNLVVEDDGIGLNKDGLARGFGFSTIQSNVDVFKGTFEIESQPGRGCLVVIDLPLDASSLVSPQSVSRSI